MTETALGYAVLAGFAYSRMYSKDDASRKAGRLMLLTALIIFLMLNQDSQNLQNDNASVVSLLNMLASAIGKMVILVLTVIQELVQS